MNTPRPVVTVDGSAASGKTVLARRLAESLGYVHLNSGLLYRAAAWVALQGNLPLSDCKALSDELRARPLSLVRSKGGECEVHIAGTRCSGDLTASEISATASIVAKQPDVRMALLSAQRDAFPGVGIVAEGRDMGTVVFPEAQIKFFVTARDDVRAQRRHAQMVARGESVTVEEILRELQERDARDAGREVAPMVAAIGAVVLDNSDRSIEESVDRMRVAVLSKVS